MIFEGIKSYWFLSESLYEIANGLKAKQEEMGASNGFLDERITLTSFFIPSCQRDIYHTDGKGKKRKKKKEKSKSCLVAT